MGLKLTNRFSSYMVQIYMVQGNVGFGKSDARQLAPGQFAWNILIYVSSFQNYIWKSLSNENTSFPGKVRQSFMFQSFVGTKSTVCNLPKQIQFGSIAKIFTLRRTETIKIGNSSVASVIFWNHNVIVMMVVQPFGEGRWILNNLDRIVGGLQGIGCFGVPLSD